jgi:hypothetical protein
MSKVYKNQMQNNPLLDYDLSNEAVFNTHHHISNAHIKGALLKMLTILHVL